MGAWAQGWQLGENVEARRQARQQQLQDQQRQSQENALQSQLASGAITGLDYSKGINDLYAHEPAESRLGRIGRGLERAVGMKKRAAAQAQAAQAKVAALPSPRADLNRIEAGAKTPEQLAAEKSAAQLSYQGQVGAQKQAQDRAASLQNVQDFKDTYKRMTGKDPSPDMLEAFTVSALGGDKVLSTMEQATALKAREEYQNATLDLRNKTLALQQARLAAQNDPNNPAFRLRLRQAQSEATNADARMRMAEARYQGTWNGVPIAGDIIDTEGNPVAPVNAPNVRPTGTQRERATLATSALDQMKDLTGLLSTRGDLFGPGAGRITNFRQWVGSPDPAAQQFKAAARTAADHLAGVFGGRSQAALDAIYDVIGNNITNPQAAIAGINQMAKAADVIQRIGSYRTVGGGGTPSPTGGKGAPAPKKEPQSNMIVVSPEDMKSAGSSSRP